MRKGREDFTAATGHAQAPSRQRAWSGDREPRLKHMRWAIRLFSAIVAGTITIGPTATPVGAADLNAAKQEFGELCARCHGPQGHGDGPDGATLATKPRDFHDCGLMAKDADAMVIREIKGGSAAIGRSNDMPSWGEAFDDNQIQDLLAYVRAFCKQK